MIDISSLNSVLLSLLYLYVPAYTEAVLIKESLVSHIKSSAIEHLSLPSLTSPPSPPLSLSRSLSLGFCKEQHL